LIRARLRKLAPHPGEAEAASNPRFGGVMPGLMAVDGMAQQIGEYL